jgi:hypothetical protein
MSLKIIRSGGQTGVDVGCVRGAKRSGKVEYEMLMPKGFRTLVGPRPEWAGMYNAREHISPHYPPRTYENVKLADATLRIAVNIESSGERCTLKAINQYKKPHFDVIVVSTSKHALPDRYHPRTFARWLLDHNVQHLNCAGNSESTAPGIEVYAECYILAVLLELETLT